jgi:sugar lactone lactonase YvrE
MSQLPLAGRIVGFRLGALALVVFSPGAALPAHGQATPYSVITFAGAAGNAGSTDGTGSGARFAHPSDVAVDAAGNLYIADTGNNTVRKVTSPVMSNIALPPPPFGTVTNLAGQAGVSGSSDGSGTGANFNHPAGIAVDNAGNVYVADTDNNEIRKVTALGVVTTLAGQAGRTGSADGSGSAASFNGPSGIVADTAGDLYVADTLNHTIRKVTSAGVVTTIAGVAGASGLADGTNSAARFHGPQGLAIDSSNNLFVADTNNNAIRRIVTATGTVTTVTGEAGTAGSTDGANSHAQFHYPSGVAVDTTGNLYVADTENHTLREISSSGAVSTLAGTADSSGSTDGVGTAAGFDFPTGASVDGSGNVYIADANNGTIRIAYLTGLPVITQQPQPVKVNPGENATLSVTATGGPLLYYNWYQNTRTVEGTTVSVDISGNRTISFTDVQNYNAGVYFVTVTNSTGTVSSSSVQLEVTPAAGGGSSGDSGGGSGGGGGGAPSIWFYGLLSVLALARQAWTLRNK